MSGKLPPTIFFLISFWETFTLKMKYKLKIGILVLVQELGFSQLFMRDFKYESWIKKHVKYLFEDLLHSQWKELQAKNTIQ